MSDRVWFVNPVPKAKAMATKRKKVRKNQQQSLGFQSRAMVLHRGGPGVIGGKKKKSPKSKKSAAKKAASPKPRKQASTMATHKKKKRPKAIYRTSKKGTRRRTVAVKGPVFRGSKRGKARRVKRINPHKRRRHHVRRNPGMGGFVGAALAVLAGFGTGVAIRVGTHMAAPGNANAAKIAGAAGALAGIAMAAKMSNPMYGIGVAVGSIDAALQNDATFKVEMMTAPAATQQALGAIVANNLRGMQNARSLPQFARINGLPAYARVSGANPMGAIVSNNMRGFADGGTIAAMRARNPFE